MKSKVLSMAVIAFLALLASVWAADITGTWIARIPGRQGTVRTIFSFKVDGPKLTGTVTDPQGETAISEGKINGDEIAFVVVPSSGRNEMKLVYKGKVAEDEIKFTREMQGRMGQQQEFIAKREFQRNGDIPLQKKKIPF
jgi:hypothetical protein